MRAVQITEFGGPEVLKITAVRSRKRCVINPNDMRKRSQCPSLTLPKNNVSTISCRKVSTNTCPPPGEASLPSNGDSFIETA